jgi:hypothetical protein
MEKYPARLKPRSRDLDAIFKDCEQFLGRCASGTKITEAEYDTVARKTMITVISGLYGVPGIEFIIDNQQEFFIGEDNE